MTKRNYEAIARAVAAEAESDEYRRISGPRARVAKHLADLFELENERFDRERFLKACDVLPKEGDA